MPKSYTWITISDSKSNLYQRSNRSLKIKKSTIEPPQKRCKFLLVCIICNGDAYGRSFGAISCESCKAFFRRHALRTSGQLKCRDNGHCDVRVTTPKRCKACRLERCLRSGMRRELILSDAEKKEQRRKIRKTLRLKEVDDNNRRHESIQQQHLQFGTDDTDLFLRFLAFSAESSLNDFEWFKIQSVQSTYTASVQLNQLVGVSFYPLTQPRNWTLDLLRIPLFISSMRLITFLKQITELQQLNEDDQVNLVKLNLIVVSFFHSMFLYDPVTRKYHEQNTTDPFYTGEDWVRTWNAQFHADIQQLRHDFLDLFASSDIMIKLSYLILIFSSRVSLNEANQFSPTQAQSSSICNAQNVFADLLYKYCLNQHGLTAAPMMFTRYVSKLMKLQQLIDEVRFTIRDYVDIRQLSPLMGSLLL